MAAAPSSTSAPSSGTRPIPADASRKPIVARCDGASCGLQTPWRFLIPGNWPTAFCCWSKGLMRSARPSGAVRKALANHWCNPPRRSSSSTEDGVELPLGKRPRGHITRRMSWLASAAAPDMSPVSELRLPYSESERPLGGCWRRDMNALELEHADLGRRAPWRRKAADPAAGSQDPVAGDDQRHRILGHRLADIAGGLGPGAKLLRDGAIGGRAPPSDPPHRGVDFCEERVLLAQIELNRGKIRLFAVEIALCGGDGVGHLRRGLTGRSTGHAPPQKPFGRFGAPCRQLEACDADVVPGDTAIAARSFEDEITVRLPAHHLTLHAASS